MERHEFDKSFSVLTLKKYCIKFSPLFQNKRYYNIVKQNCAFV
jgi:hypothetical protein